MRNNICVLLLISGLFVSCFGSTSLVQFNEQFIKEREPLSNWDKDLLRLRARAFRNLNIHINSNNTVYLIEEYNVEYLYYSGLLYIDENHYYRFCREGIDEQLIILNEGLTDTEKYIISELHNSEYDNIKEKSRNTELISPSTLFITILHNKAMKSNELLILNKFYIE